jgi:hypothetical protein
VIIRGEAVAVVVQKPLISPEKAALDAQMAAPPLIVKEPVCDKAKRQLVPAV